MKKIVFKAEHNELFFTELQRRIDQYFIDQDLSKKGTPLAFIKGGIFWMLYLSAYSITLFSTSILPLFCAFAAMGVLKIFLALNVAHDAAHRAMFKKSKWNDLLVYLFDFLGANGYLWKLRHVHSHHPYPNIPGYDVDITQTDVVRIFPNSPIKWFHRYQHFYMPVLYLFYTLNWLLFRDFKDFTLVPVNSRGISQHKPKEYIRLIMGKFFYVTMVLVIPSFISSFSFWTILTGFIIMQFTASYTVSLALASAHVGEHAIFPETNESLKMNTSWAIHQLNTTTDFATRNEWITHLFGGFNHHAIHHLFPGICHIHYPNLTPILIKTCQDFGLHYQYNPTLWGAICSHFRLLKQRSNFQLIVAFPEF